MPPDWRKWAEATFKNWESEFLQMGMYVVLTVFLFQRGSSESKPIDEPAPQDSCIVGFSVYLRERGSPESKPVSEPSFDTGA